MRFDLHVSRPVDCGCLFPSGVNVDERNEANVELHGIADRKEAAVDQSEATAVQSGVNGWH